MRFTPDEIKSLVLLVGSYEKLSDKVKVSKTSLVRAANADIDGRAYRLTDDNYDALYLWTRRLPPEQRKDIRKYEALLDSIGDHPNVKRAFMAGNHKDRQAVKDLKFRAGYRKLKSRNFWGKIMAKFYDKYGWRRGRFSR